MREYRELAENDWQRMIGDVLYDVSPESFLRTLIPKIYKQALIDARGCVGEEKEELKEGEWAVEDDDYICGHNSHRTATLQNLDDLISTIETKK